METNDNLKQNDFTTPPDNYLVWAILSTVLCCLPLGIVSIIKSSEVNSKWNRGDYTGAMESSAAAKKWAIWSAIASLVVGVIYLIFIMVAGAAYGFDSLLGN